MVGNREPDRAVALHPDVEALGGLGILWGTLGGGVILGVAQTVGASINPEWQLLAGHIAFLVVLAAAPRGTHVGRSRSSGACAARRAQRGRWLALPVCGPRRLRFGAGNPWMERRRIAAFTALGLTVMPYPSRSSARILRFP